MDKNKLRILIISGIMGLGVVILIPIYLQQEVKRRVAALASVQPAVEEGYVLQAIRDIPRGQTVDKGALALRKIPVNFIQPGAVNSGEQVVGKMALVDILNGEQITASKLSTPESFKGLATTSLSMITPPGKRAVTIPMDPMMAAAGMVRPGDYVDILADFPLPQEMGGTQANQIVTVTLFQNILVLAVGNQLREAALPSARQARGGEAPAPAQSAQTITFALAPQEAALMNYAYQQGKLKLILRPPLDTQTQPLPVASGEALWQYILSTQGINISQSEQGPQTPSVEQKPAAPSPVEVYRGGRK